MGLNVKSRLVMTAIQACTVFFGLYMLPSVTAHATSDDNVPVLAYITDVGANTVSIIDTTTDTVTATVNVGGAPFAVGVRPDGRRAYVANHDDATVSVIDGVSKSVIATISVGPNPLGVAVSPDGTKVYVANSAGGGSGAGVSVIDAATNLVTAEIPLSVVSPSAAAVSADGRSLYVGAFDVVVVIDTATNQVVANIPLPLGSGPDSIALAPNLPFGYAVNSPSGEIAALNLGANKTYRSVTTGGGNVQAVAVSPDGRRAYATDSNLDQVVVFASASERIVTRISLPTGTNPVGISLTPDGKKAYVAGNASSSVFVIDTTANTILTTVSVVGFPYAKGQFIATQLPE